MMPWPEPDRWRAPVGDFPPPWASTWGDDSFGLWADLTVNGVTQRMRWIEPSGAEGFLMGAPQIERDVIPHMDVRQSANRNRHDPQRVVIARGFWLADTPCTQVFWQTVMGGNPSRFNAPDAAQCPVERVNWDDVMQFLAALAAVPERRLSSRVALPAEVEWEYAARAGSTGAYWWGDRIDPAQANVKHDRSMSFRIQQGTTPVKHYPASPWGLFDVHGNVWEWCKDSWQAPKTQPNPSALVVRGGSWFHDPGEARSDYRRKWPRVNRYSYQGFRLLLKYLNPNVESHSTK